MTVHGHSAKSLVDFARGEISREVFVNEEIYQEELERVFTRGWLYVGHTSQIKKPGDYFVSCMGEESVILTRDPAGKVHVFLNTCRHRGMKVCRYDEGHTVHFVCPYHGWSYATDGRLVGVPQAEKAYRPPLDRSQWALIEVAQIAQYRGTVWATWDHSAPALLDYLGEAKLALDLALGAWDGSDEETELLGSVQKWLIPANWKFVAENFSGDGLHVVSHRSVDLVGIGPTDGEGRRDDPGKLMMTTSPQWGHGLTFSYLPPDPNRTDYAASPAASQYFKQCWKKRIERMGDRAGLQAVVGTIFPNLSFHGQQPRTLLVAHPRGVAKTEMWRVYFADRNAPEEVKQFLRHYYIRYSGPAGMTEQDDMENWNYATAASRGSIARRYPYNYKAGLGAEETNEMVPGVVTNHPISLTTEQNPRNFYKRWAEFMDAKSWRDLKPSQVDDLSEHRR
ncbi:MAG: aromatic ring-hydroxylating dioxygenase subunit alpha [Candidatus Binataceae bacterium]|nr:aromatic ring-hydroxylating dioxygenase subunit alpha [Candidatus Binataceae bacterium]